MGSCSSSNITVADIQTLKPRWTSTVSFKTDFLSDKIEHFTTGFRAINNNTVELTGTGKNKVDGARWSRGFTSGKHVIEFIYPIHLRGTGSRVGLGAADKTLETKKVNHLAGENGSWAIDLVKLKAIHNGKVECTFPVFKKELPDWFFMYVDLDLGTMQFGSDSEFFGTAFTDVSVGTGPLYPIVSASIKGTIIGMIYRGEGKEISGPLRKRRALTRQTKKKPDRKYNK